MSSAQAESRDHAMRLQGLRIFVDDLAAARQFYHEILELPIDQDAEAEDRALIGRFVGCAIAVDDIAATYAALTAKRVKFTGPPERQPWGGVFAHFEAPSHNVLTLLGG